MSVGCGLVAAATLGIAVYSAFSVVDFLSPEASFRRASHDLDVGLLSLVGAVIAVVLAVVALFRARPKLVATCALVLAVVLPFVSGAFAVKLGVDALAGNAAAAASALGTTAVPLIEGLLTYLGVDPAPFHALLEQLFG